MLHFFLGTTFFRFIFVFYFLTKQVIITLAISQTTDKKNTYYYWAFIILVLLDQVSKIIAKDYFNAEHYMSPVQVIGDFLQFTYVENEGMAFGISWGPFKIVLSCFSIVASLALIYILQRLKNASAFVKIGVMFILAGAVGNLVDRVFYGIIFGESALFYGRVVDFILVDIPDIDFMGLNYTHWPVFNIADACVTVGVIFLLLFNSKIPPFHEIFGKKKKS